jgi:hypothetical protein
MRAHKRKTWSETILPIFSNLLISNLILWNQY